MTTAVVEAMEENFKKDILLEVRAGNGRILLHDEVEERPGVFSIIPIWEHVSDSDIMTPRDVFDLMVSEGYRVDYARVAVVRIFFPKPRCCHSFPEQTDEQAPLPVALSQLLERVRSGLDKAGDFVFNCQMGRGRTTSGMVTACLIATVTYWDSLKVSNTPPEIAVEEQYDSIDGPSEEEAYLQGILSYFCPYRHGDVNLWMSRRIQDYFASRWRTQSWQNGEADDR